MEEQKEDKNRYFNLYQQEKIGVQLILQAFSQEITYLQVETTNQINNQAKDLIHIQIFRRRDVMKKLYLGMNLSEQDFNLIQDISEFIVLIYDKLKTGEIQQEWNKMVQGLREMKV